MCCVGRNARARSGMASCGVILVTVLWVLALLSLIATSLSLGSRSFSRQTFGMEQGTRAGLAADAGISWAMWNLQQPPASGWLADGRVYWMWLENSRIGVRLQDESGKLDLNVAPAELLDALLSPVMQDNLQRAQLVAAIEDWRDSDDLVRLNGAEADEYQQAGRTTGPANRPFASLQELQQVLGMSREVYLYVLPHLTLMTRVRTINPRFASFEVLMALPNASADVVSRYIEQRREAWDEGLPLPTLPFEAAPYTDERRSNVHYRVDVEAREGSEARLRRSARLMRQGARIQLTLERPLPGEILLADPAEEGAS